MVKYRCPGGGAKKIAWDFSSLLLFAVLVYLVVNRQKQAHATA